MLFTEKNAVSPAYEKGKEALLRNIPNNPVIAEAFKKAWDVVNSDYSGNIVVSVSGGSDSDLLVHLMSSVDVGRKVRYVFTDPGLELDANKRHISYYEQRYGIDVVRLICRHSVPEICKEKGAPFLSKRVSEEIHRLQYNGFPFVDGSFAELYEAFPRCQSALQWWCNCNIQYNIKLNKGLKEFLISRGPAGIPKISQFCCGKSKVPTSAAYLASLGGGMSVVGVRKAEGGCRARLKDTLSYGKNEGGTAVFRPILYFSDKDKAEFNAYFNVVNSEAYTTPLYPLPRTGCCCCPCAPKCNRANEIRHCEIYEPDVLKRAQETFKEVYGFEKEYRDFVKGM